MSRASKYLTAQFYEWEKRGRGWVLFDGPVDPEPSFYPFFKHYVPPFPVTDESRKETLLSLIAGAFQRKPKPVAEEVGDINIRPIYEQVYENDSDPAVICITFPKGQKIEVAATEQLLCMLSTTEYPVSFEIVGTHTDISIQIFCSKPDEALIQSQIKAFFPTAILSKGTKENIDILIDGFALSITDFGLAQEFMCPLAMPKSLDPDPATSIYGVLENLQEGERCIVQVFFKGCINPWAESIMRSVLDPKGGSFLDNEPNMPKLAQEKISAPFFGVCIRAIAQAELTAQARTIIANITRALEQSTRSQHNSLVALSYYGISEQDVCDDVLIRQTHRMGMLLNARELATLVHFPSQSVAASKIVRTIQKTKTLPALAKGNTFILGENIHQGVAQPVSVPSNLRLKHTHIIGATGTGKSTLLVSMIAQDMQQDNGVAVLDPHGDLIETILAHVPENRIQDVIIIDPADADYPVGFNILSAHSEIEKDILSSDLVAAFRRLSTSWGDQMNSVFANAILAFLEGTGGTLVDLRRFLIEKPFRDTYLKTVKDPNVVYYWQHEYPLLKSGSIGPILTRLDTFLRPKLIRNMVAQKKGLDFENILDTQKILLVKLSQGLIGAENSYILGTFFVSKIYQAAMARQAKGKEDHKDFFLYIDEFQNFITPSMSHILSGARKYHLGLVLAHQDMQQLQKYDSELASSVVVNAGTRICFRLGDVDARRFASGFSYFEAEDLENLHTGEAIARIEQPAFDFNLSTVPLQEPQAEDIRDRMLAASREKYGTPKNIVEQSLSHLGKMEEVEQVAEPMPKEPVEQKPLPEKQPEYVPVPPIEIQSTYTPIPKAETEHRYLQTFIKRMGESRGYKALLEETTPDGKGRVDVHLEKNGKKIACEISVTTNEAWEVHNVEKCLAAGYDEVIVCSKNVKHLQKIRRQIENSLDEEQQKRVYTFGQDEVLAFFDKQMTQESSTETVMKGYRVKVEYNTSSQQETAQKHEQVVKAVRKSIIKKKT